MYLEHFGLRELPFNLTPDTSFVFEHDSFQAGLNTLRIAVRSGEGFLKITGEVGLGKTLMCRTLLNELSNPFLTAYIPNPSTTPKGLLVMLAEELGFRVTPATTHDKLLKAISGLLLDNAKKGLHTVLLIDEAQTMSDQTLETVRLLTNLETEKFKLLQVILFGQPELDRRLAEPQLRQLRQRITFSYTLEPLDYDSFVRYVGHRMAAASDNPGMVFTDQALRMIYRASRGTPRLVNILCHKSLMAAYGPGESLVGPAAVRIAVADTEAVQTLPWYRRLTGSRPVVALTAMSVLGAVLASWAWS